MQAKLRIEETKMAALEADRRAAKEAGEKEAYEASKRIAAALSQQEAAKPQLIADSSNLNLQPQGSGSNRTKKSQTTGILFLFLRASTQISSALINERFHSPLRNPGLKLTCLGSILILCLTFL